MNSSDVLCSALHSSAVVYLRRHRLATTEWPLAITAAASVEGGASCKCVVERLLSIMSLPEPLESGSAEQVLSSARLLCAAVAPRWLHLCRRGGGCAEVWTKRRRRESDETSRRARVCASVQCAPICTYICASEIPQRRDLAVDSTAASSVTPIRTRSSCHLHPAHQLEVLFRRQPVAP